MNQPDASDSRDHRGSAKTFRTKATGGAAVALFLAAYAFAQPWLNETMGWNLPGLRQDSNGNIVADSKPSAHAATQTKVSTKGSTGADHQNTQQASDNKKTSGKYTDRKSAKTTEPQNQKQTTPPKSTSKPGPLASRIRPSKNTESSPSRGPPAKPSADSDLRYGLLREVGRDRYMSPAGLLYAPGSAEGHRLEHLRRHVKDIPARPIHGVFDGGMEGALKTIDQAYEKAKKGIRTTKQVDGRRTIYKVDMGKRIGYTGGKEGARKRKPMARRVQLVLEGTQVITAYPL